MTKILHYDATVQQHSLTPSGRIGKVVASHAEGCKIESRLWLSCTDSYYARGAQGALPLALPMRVGGATKEDLYIEEHKQG